MVWNFKKIGQFTLLLVICNIGINAVEVQRRSIKYAKLGRFPWHVYIKYEREDLSCSGALISDQWVITAASCVVDQHNWELWFGFVDFKQKPEVIMKSIKQIMQPNYLGIALLKLEKKIKFTKNIQLIGLVPNDYIGDELFITGYSMETLNANNPAKHLMYASLKREMSFENCAKQYEVGELNESFHLCAESHNKSKERLLCSDDFGAPVVTAWYQYKFLVGIFTGLNVDCREPFVFTRINGFLEWIENKSGVHPGPIREPPELPASSVFDNDDDLPIYTESYLSKDEL